MRSYRQVDFAFLADHRVKIKAIEKRVIYLDLAREQRKLGNMMVIPIVIGTFGMVPPKAWKRSWKS